jgi:hypothetical protein
MHGCEGLQCDVVATKFDAPYRLGSSKNWTKVKESKVALYMSTFDPKRTALSVAFISGVLDGQRLRHFRDWHADHIIRILVAQFGQSI